jgi:hypothetical protein
MNDNIESSDGSTTTKMSDKKNKKEAAQEPKAVQIAPPGPCTIEDLALMNANPFLKNSRKALMMESRCPAPSKWLDKMLLQLENRNPKGTATSRLGVTFGCNKGVDAIGTAKHLGIDPAFDKKQSIDTMRKQMFIKKPACPDGYIGTKSSFLMTKTTPLQELAEESFDFYCIEPMPSTSQTLQRTLEELDLQKAWLSRASVRPFQCQRHR